MSLPDYIRLTEAGAAGLAFGGIAGTIRSSTPVLFALASGVQFSALGSVYYGTVTTLRLRQLLCGVLIVHAATRQGSVVWLARHNSVHAADLSPAQLANISAGSGAVSGASAAALFRASPIECQPDIQC